MVTLYRNTMTFILYLLIILVTFLDSSLQQHQHQQQMLQQPQQQVHQQQQQVHQQQQQVHQQQQQVHQQQQQVHQQQPQQVLQQQQPQQQLLQQQPQQQVLQHQPQQLHQQPQQQQNAVNWFENLPAVAMDYKVHIDPGKEDCYFQYVNPGATFYVSFQVVRGGDGMAGFAVRNPSGQIVHPYQWRAHSDYQDHQSTGGYYSVCIDNQFSRFADKLVNLYITVIRYDQWDQYTKEMTDLNVSVENFTASIMTVERNINEMLQYQNHLRGTEARDFNLISDNNDYVLNWSLVQIMVIIGTTVLQVHFVRRLFEVKPGKTRV